MPAIRPREGVEPFDIRPGEDTGDKITVSADGGLTAGRWTTLQVDIQLGKGLKKGAGLAVFVPPGFTLPQVQHPSHPGYTTASAGGGETLELGPFTIPGLKTEYERAVVIRPQAKDIAAGTTISLRFGDTSEGSPGVQATRMAWGALPMECIRIKEGIEHPPLIESSPRVSVEAGPVKGVRGFIEPVAAKGEELRLRLVAEDQYGNLVPSSLKTSVKGLPTKAGRKDVKLRKGRAVVPITAERTGVFYPAASCEAGDVAFGPVQVTDAAPEYRLFFGELHVHTEISSDGNGTIEEACRHGRDTAGLDFLSVTDHMTGAAGMTGYSVHCAGSPGFDRSKTPPAWEKTCRTMKDFHEPGAFVTFCGFEADTTGPAGHRNVYFPDDAPEMMEMPSFPPPAGFLSEWAKGRKVLIVPHHPPIAWGVGVKEGGGLVMEEVPPQFQPVVEIYSRHGTSEHLHNHRPLRGQRTGHFVSDFLDRGHRFGFIAGSDSHWANPGTSMLEAGHFPTLQYRSGLAAVWAKELTREAIWEALFARRCYATTYPRIILRMDVDGVGMGQEGSSSRPRTVRCEVYSPLNVNRIEIIRNGVLVGGLPDTTHPPMPSATQGIYEWVDEEPSDREEDCYYLRVWMGNGERAWSSPVWLRNR